MVNRVQEIIRRYNLSPSKLADQLEVPRSTISHILSERNKPSLEFLQKVLENYPDINTDWLIKGEGDIFGNRKDLFSQMEISEESKKEKPNVLKESFQPKQTGLFPPENPIKSSDKATDKVPENPVREKTAVTTDEQVEFQKDMNENKIKKQQVLTKKMVKLVAFYEDNTFEEFYPTQKE